MEAAINTVSAKDPAFTSNPSALSYAPSRTASGKVRQVSFLDPEVAYWQTATQHAMVNGNSTNTPSAVNVHALDGTRCDAAGHAEGAGHQQMCKQQVHQLQEQPPRRAQAAAATMC
jgi:hypothetical protein